MPSATQVTPAASIDTIVGEVFSGQWSRTGDDRIDNHPELFEIELFRHLSSHAGEVALWTIQGAIGPEASDDEYSVPLPALIDLAGSYCWRVRLRDNFGSWTDWTSKATFSYTSQAPVLTNPTIPDGSTFETLAHVFFGADYEDADGDRPHRLYITLHPFTALTVSTVVQLMRPEDSGGYQGSGLTRMLWLANGDNPQSGDNPNAVPKAGLGSYIGSIPTQTGIRADGFGSPTVHLAFSVSKVTGGDHTFTGTIRVNGVIVATSTQFSTGGLRSQQWDADFSAFGIDISDTDVVEAFCHTTNNAPVDVIPYGVGSASHELRLTGELSAEDEVDPTAIMWKTNGQYHGFRDSAKVGTWYNGRALGPRSYLWEMYATDKRGSQSNTLSGTITLTKGTEPDPGASPNLTGYASP